MIDGLEAGADRFRHFEPDRFRGGNLQRFACPRIAAFAGRTLLEGEPAESIDGDIVAALGGLDDRRKNGSHDVLRLGLRKVVGGGDGVYEFCGIQRMVLRWVFVRRQSRTREERLSATGSLYTKSR